jgi:hypothetical protein
MHELAIDSLPFVSIFTPDMMDGFWQYLKVFLFIGAPLLMIYAAVELGGYFVDTLKKAIFSKKKEDDDDDDWD